MDALMANQIILYENDAVLVSYTNGAGLQLAPCGSVFTYHHPLKDGEHPIHGQKKVLQRTQFVTSTFKSSVIEAIDFRNRFAHCPYLCKDIIDQKRVSKLHADICEIAWSEKLEKANIKILEDHSIMVTSLCNCAKLSLSSSKQLFTVQFLCRMSQQQEKEKWSPLKKETDCNKEETESEDRVDRMWKYCVKSKDSNLILSKENQKSSHISQQSSASVFKEGEWDYTWVVQHFSVHDCPKIWQHPLNLAQEAMQKQRFVKFETDSEKNSETVEEQKLDPQSLNLNDSQNLDELSYYMSGLKTDNNIPCDIAISIPTLSEKTDVKRLTNCVFSSVPKSLQLNCVSSHLHKWGSKDFWDAEEKQAESALVNGRIKVICARGVIYRFLWEQPKAIEIYPGDGTVLRSSGLAGQFFTHFINNNGKVEEKMYAVNMPPPDIPGSIYSIARLLKRGERYLRHLYEDSLNSVASNQNYCCWKIQPAARKIHEPLPNTLLEQCLVNGVGKFTAYSSGRVRIVFTDRTALDMYANFSKRLGHCKQHSDQETHHMPDVHSYQPKSANVRTLGSDLPQGVCRLMLPNGHYRNVIMTYPEPQFEKYVKAAKEWASWVNCSPNERNTFYKDTLHDAVKVGEIDRELRKIMCFNYIVEKTLLSQFDTKPTQGVSMNHSLNGRSFNNDDSLYSSKYSHTDTAHTNKLVGELKQLSDNFSSNDLLCNTAYIPPAVRHSTAMEDQSVNTIKDAQSRSHTSTTQEYDSIDIGHESAYNLAMVEQILNKTSQAVSDLDRYLKSNGEQQPVKDQ